MLSERSLVKRRAFLKGANVGAECRGWHLGTYRYISRLEAPKIHTSQHQKSTPCLHIHFNIVLPLNTDVVYVVRLQPRCGYFLRATERGPSFLGLACHIETPLSHPVDLYRTHKPGATWQCSSEKSALPQQLSERRIQDRDYSKERPKLSYVLGTRYQHGTSKSNKTMTIITLLRELIINRDNEYILSRYR